MTVNIGSKASLNCSHDGKTPHITWWRVVHGNLTEASVLMSQGPVPMLSISNVNKSHRGLYRCSVTENNVTKHSCGTYLLVRGE